jgi:hypothetical protein
MDKYKLGGKNCGECLKNGGVSIFVRYTLHCTNINLDEFCKEQDIEAYAVRLNYSHYIYLKIANNENFLHTLDSVLIFLYNTIQIIICSDFNINYLNDNEKKVN